MNRNQRQEDASKSMLASIRKNDKIYCNISPRFGKTKTTIDFLNLYKAKKILVVIPNNSMIKGWEQECTLWNLNGTAKYVNKSSLHKLQGQKYDAIIIDEIHKLSERQFTSLYDIKGKKIGLSGSIGDSTKEGLDATHWVEAYDFGIQKAIDAGIIADFDIHVISIKPDSKLAYIEAGSKTKKFNTTEAANLAFLDKFVNKMRGIHFARNNPATQKGWMNAASKRANAIYNFDSKISLAKKIINECIPNQERVLAFTARTEVAEKLCPGQTINSKTTTEAFDKFIAEESNRLVACQMVDTGITFPNLKVGVFHQIQSNEEDLCQKVMRMCNKDGNKKAKIVILQYKDTQDEKWVSKALMGLPEDKIQHHTWTKDYQKKFVSWMRK